MMFRATFFFPTAQFHLRYLVKRLPKSTSTLLRVLIDKITSVLLKQERLRKSWHCHTIGDTTLTTLLNGIIQKSGKANHILISAAAVNHISIGVHYHNKRIGCYPHE